MQAPGKNYPWCARVTTPIGMGSDAYKHAVSYHSTDRVQQLVAKGWKGEIGPPNSAASREAQKAMSVKITYRLPWGVSGVVRGIQPGNTPRLRVVLSTRVGCPFDTGFSRGRTGII